MEYSEKVMDHFMNPRNVGEIENASGVGQVGNMKCGDIMKVYLQIEDGKIVDAKFKTFGCGAAVATSCRVQVMEIKNDTGYGRAAEIREKERMQKALDALGKIEVRKMMPWEKLLSDRQEQETYYTMMIWYDSETEGRYESLSCWENGRIDFRDASYRITGEPKTKAVDLLETLLQEYETEGV